MGEAFGMLCKFSLIYRQGGLVNLLSPFHLYLHDAASIYGMFGSYPLGC